MELRGIRVHNLQGIDVTIPWGKWVAISGVSGSGKSSLAFDTLYAEGQRRYLESLSPRSRQFLEQMPLPEADHIDPLPAAVAVRQTARMFPRRATVGSATEISHYLRLLFAKVGSIVCPECNRAVDKHTPQDVLNAIHSLPAGRRYQIAFPQKPPSDENDLESWVSEELIERGFTRGIWNHKTINLSSVSLSAEDFKDELLVVVDRLTAGKSGDERVTDSLELAFSASGGRCTLLGEDSENSDDPLLIDGKPWRIEEFSDRLECATCRREFPDPEPRLFNPQSPAGACETCGGTGSVKEFSLDELVADPNRTLAEGALACFREAPIAEREIEWLEQARSAGIAWDVPFFKLQGEEKSRLSEGDPAHDFPGLRKLFEELQSSKKANAQDFLDRWFVSTPCPECRGQKLRGESLAVRIAGQNIADVSRQPLSQFQQRVKDLPEKLTAAEQKLMSAVLAELQSRTDSLLELGLGYLTLASPVAALSSGEAQRVAIARIVGHQLVNSLYIFDEPSTGLHPSDCRQVTRILARLNESDNTVIVVEHEEDFLKEADHLIDLGPGGGREGGRVVFQGLPEEIASADDSRTARFLTGNETVHRPHRPTGESQSQLTLRNIQHFPFEQAGVEIPLNCLAVLTGVSGSGKSVLLEQILHPALQHALGKPLPRSVRNRFGELLGSEEVENVVLLDQSPPGGRSRSNPATYLNFFDDIRRVFADSPEAQKQGFGLKAFSFNSSAGGRCPNCGGQGIVNVEMQFLADLEMLCPECQGTRYRPEILTARYRGLNIAEVLNLTVAEAFTFFRTSPRIRKRLQVLKDVGLDYLPIGQATSTLSGGESQRLKLASFLSGSPRGHTVFLLDEPTSGLHPADLQILLNCFDHLLAVGHSVIVAEHSLHLIQAADWIIDLGPGPFDAGGQVLAAGPAEEIASCAESLTGRALHAWKQRAEK